jgi:hypothetical protein
MPSRDQPATLSTEPGQSPGVSARSAGAEARAQLAPEAVSPPVPWAVRRRFWASLGLLAGLLLAGSYFMPAVSCQEEGIRVNPSQEVRHFVKSEARSWTALPPVGSARSVDWLMYLVVYITPYVFGLLAAAGAASRLAGNPHGQRWATLSLAALGLTAAVALFYCCAFRGELWGGRVSFHLGEGNVPTLLAAVWAAILCIRAVVIGPRAHLSLTFCGALLCVWWWFHVFRVIDWPWGMEYGWSLAVVATVLLLPATFAEYRTLTLARRGRALLQLLACRPAVFVTTGQCPACGYSIRGLPAPRCPECGRPFPPAEVDEEAR